VPFAFVKNCILYDCSPPPLPPPRRQHFRENFSGALFIQKCPSKPPPPQSFYASYAPGYGVTLVYIHELVVRGLELDTTGPCSSVSCSAASESPQVQSLPEGL
jgi:hypothetical protein